MNKNRYLIKLSGEAFKAEKVFFDFKFANHIVKQIIDLVKQKKEIVIVIGGGNICRMKDYTDQLHGSRAKNSLDYAGMLGTIINGLCLKESFANLGFDIGLLTLLSISSSAVESYSLNRAENLLKTKKILILVGGMGICNFSTDLVAMVKSKELNIKCILFGKIGIDGVYTDDPKINKNAKFLKVTTFQNIIEQKLRFIDLTAAAFGLENDNILYLFDIKKTNNITNIINEKGDYSIVKN